MHKLKSMHRFKIQFLIILSLFVFIGCTNKKNEQVENAKIPTDSELTNIICELIKLNSWETGKGYCIDPNFSNYIRDYEFEDNCDELNPPCPGPPNLIYLNYIKMQIETFANSSFSENDSLYFIAQIDSSSNRKITKELIKDIEFISTEEFLSEECDCHTLYTFSMPLFTLNKKIVIIQFNVMYKTSGYGNIIILKKENDKYSIVCTFPKWET